MIPGSDHKHDQFWIDYRSKCKRQNNNILNEDIDQYFQNPEVHRNVLNRTQKALTIEGKKKIDKIDYFKMNNHSSSGTIIKRVKRQAI